MDLVAVDDGLAVFESWHEGREAANLALSFNEDVTQFGRPHLLHLVVGMPADCGAPIISPAGFLDEIEAGYQVSVGDACSLLEFERVFRAS